MIIFPRMIHGQTKLDFDITYEYYPPYYSLSTAHVVVAP